MPKLIYRVVSACGALGYGYPKESLQAALRGQVDAIICDGGSMDAGPYYLGTGTEYFEREAVKADFRHMVEAGNKTRLPGHPGQQRHGRRRPQPRLDDRRPPRRFLPSLSVRDAKVAVIRSELDPEIVIREFRAGALRATGVGPELSEDALRESTIVGQMGIHPLMTALESGAQYILAGRSCDIALFASDMIRRGIDAGLAYHVGHVLECGALACDPGSPSDCLVAEVYDDGSAHLHRAQSGAPLHRLFDRRALALRGEPSATAVLSRGHSGDGEDGVLLPRRAHRRHPQQPLRARRQALALEHQARGIAPARRAQGLADLYRSGRSCEDSG